ISMKDPYTNKEIKYRFIQRIDDFKNDYAYNRFLNDISYYPYLKNKDLMENKKEKDLKIEKILSKYKDKYEVLYDIKYVYIFKNQKITRYGTPLDFKEGIYYETRDYLPIIAYLLNENIKGDKI
ncbi:hypothetical protein, partial [Oceanivirga salmonicida]